MVPCIRLHLARASLDPECVLASASMFMRAQGVPFTMTILIPLRLLVPVLQASHGMSALTRDGSMARMPTAQRELLGSISRCGIQMIAAIESNPHRRAQNIPLQPGLAARQDGPRSGQAYPTGHGLKARIPFRRSPFSSKTRSVTSALEEAVSSTIRDRKILPIRHAALAISFAVCLYRRASAAERALPDSIIRRAQSSYQGPSKSLGWRHGARVQRHAIPFESPESTAPRT